MRTNAFDFLLAGNRRTFVLIFAVAFWSGLAYLGSALQHIM